MKKASPILSLHDIHKTFGPVQALRGVNLEVFGGKVHAVIGENGAGKSTLMKILSGAYQPDKGGSMQLHGKKYRPSNPAEGRLAGIAMIYQELTLAPHLSIEENVMLGVELSKWGLVKHQRQRVREALSWLGHENLSPDTPVAKLSIGQKQLVEIARALVSEASVVIMDEPTSSLSGDDSKTLFEVVRKLRNKGIAVLYISHFLEEVTEVCDCFTVLRDGETVASGEVANSSISKMIEHMVGRSVDKLYPVTTHEIGEKVLEVKHLSAYPVPRKVSFRLHRGEILGIAGLVGSGRSETIRALFGLEEVSDGTLGLKQSPELSATWVSPPKALQLGMDLLSENRKEEGLALNMSLISNITLSGLGKYSSWGLLALKKEYRAAESFIEQLQLKCWAPEQKMQTLSGGNQQKACFARLLHHDSAIFFLDEPTRGIDVGSKVEIYRIIQKLARQGKAIVLVSSYLPELFGVCDSLSVMHRGQLSPVKPISEWQKQNVMLYATLGKL